MPFHDIYITREIRGRSDEAYGRFYTFESPRQVKVGPLVRILDARGNEVAPEKMEFG